VDDLARLLTLGAAWKDREAADIARSLLASLHGALELDVAHVWLHAQGENAPIEAALSPRRSWTSCPRCRTRAAHCTACWVQIVPRGRVPCLVTSVPGTRHS
jgi:hypothetical protein